MNALPNLEGFRTPPVSAFDPSEDMGHARNYRCPGFCHPSHELQAPLRHDGQWSFQHPLPPISYHDARSLGKLPPA
jgi:hypothetical protein